MTLVAVEVAWAKLSHLKIFQRSWLRTIWDFMMDFLRTPWAKMESKNSFGTTKILPIFWDTRLLDPRLLEGILLSQWASGWILGMVNSRPTHAIPPDAAERNRVAQPSQRDVNPHNHLQHCFLFFRMKYWLSWRHWKPFLQYRLDPNPSNIKITRQVLV